jgi:hypothetical protein
MRILVYFDTPRQRSYFNMIRDVFADDETVEVIASGPGATGAFFEVENLSGKSIATANKEFSLIRFALGHNQSLCTRKSSDAGTIATFLLRLWSPVASLGLARWTTVRLQSILPQKSVDREARRPGLALLRNGIGNVVGTGVRRAWASLHAGGGGDRERLDRLRVAIVPRRLGITMVWNNKRARTHAARPNWSDDRLSNYLTSLAGNATARFKRLEVFCKSSLFGRLIWELLHAVLAMARWVVVGLARRLSLLARLLFRHMSHSAQCVVKALRALQSGGKAKSSTRKHAKHLRLRTVILRLSALWSDHKLRRRHRRLSGHLRRSTDSAPHANKKKSNFLKKWEARMLWCASYLRPVARIIVDASTVLAGAVLLFGVALMTRFKPFPKWSFLVSFSDQMRLSVHAIDMLTLAKPDLLVMMEDNVEGLTALVAAAARKLAIPLGILPDYIPNPLEPAQYYSSSLEHHLYSLADRAFAFSNSHWVFRHNGREMVRLPLKKIIGHRISRLQEVRPWILNAGYAEKILLDSPSSIKLYEELGFKSQKLKLVGSPVDDTLFRLRKDQARKRSALLKSLKLQSGKKILVCAFPPDQYSVYTTKFEFETFEAMCDAWFDVLKRVGKHFNIIVKPHPRLDRKRLEKYEKKGIRICDLPTENLIPLADLYLASISSTIRWALAVGVPVINYDSYRYDYGDFDAAAGIINVNTAKDCASALEGLAGDQIIALKGKAKLDALSWGLVDGEFSKRLKRELSLIVRERRIPSPSH